MSAEANMLRGFHLDANNLLRLHMIEPAAEILLPVDSFHPSASVSQGLLNAGSGDLHLAEITHHRRIGQVVWKMRAGK